VPWIRTLLIKLLQLEAAAYKTFDCHFIFSFLSFKLKKACSLVAPEIRPIWHVHFWSSVHYILVLCSFKGWVLFAPFTQSNLFPKLISFFHVKFTKFVPPFGEGLIFYYISHVVKMLIPHVHRAQPLNGFENGSNLADNRIEYVLLTSWDGNSIFFSANQAWHKLPLNRFTEWNFLRNNEKAYQIRK